ncbi:GNAT family N-acetyltransferase [Acidovorax carolinensis]|uniref:GNAT family N-acetyltransferase n=1 Tax=Acidovorax carolinensis TaxID=553814 RepID=A0A240UCU9_9BURK|nr:GNAT family N-acetyltransferase [Acidovorax carolinensis]ART54939.1 GNAT family N-acetyltransferase [Acidovorax carolinensis]ART59331.1 GNAT family N-acetyltransferase [Acidovorax carolinensis]
MTLRAPEPLAAQHRLEGFDCGKPALNDWLLRHARQAQGSGSAKTFVVAEDDGHVAGYFSLTVGKVDTLEAPERIRKGMGQYPLPVVILARLAVSIHDQGRGIGFGLLQDAIRRTMLIAEQAGIRAMLTHPIDDDAAQFYTRFGFIASPLREQQLLLLLKDAKKFIR